MNSLTRLGISLSLHGNSTDEGLGSDTFGVKLKLKHDLLFIVFLVFVEHSLTIFIIVNYVRASFFYL